MSNCIKLGMVCMIGSLCSALAIAENPDAEKEAMNQAAFDSVQESLAPLNVNQIKDIFTRVLKGHIAVASSNINKLKRDIEYKKTS